MIFVTVGGQMPFDRLVMAVDAWVARTGRTDVFAQIGPDARIPEHMPWVEFLEPPEYRRHCREADLIISHAGMGTIISALEFAKPLVVMPRRALYAETRNDHQVATTRRFRGRGSIVVCDNELELAGRLEKPFLPQGSERLGPYATPDLLERISRFISEDSRTRKT